MGKGKDVAECCVACGAAALCCIVTLVVLGLIGLGIAKIVMGAIYIHDCPIEKMIPIYLIVSGVAPIFFGGFSRRSGEDQSDSGSTGGTICGTIGLLFNLAWLICGSVWTYPNFAKLNANDFIPCSGNVTMDCTEGTCNKPLITFAVAMVTIDWILIVLWIGVLGCAVARLCRA